MEIPVNDVQPGDAGMDKIQVVSSALRILPRSKVHTERQLSNSRRRRETVQSWRRPRQHHFVTNTADRLPPPPIVRVYPPVDRSERFYDRGFRKGQRRIIYYANLPEIVRPPSQWYNNRGDYPVYDSRQTYPSTSSSSYSPATVFPPLNDNDITRVQSNIIDVSNSRYNGYPSSSNPPKFTIIDVDPPYNYRGYTRQPAIHYDPYPPPNRFYDTRTPPYRDFSTYPTQNFRPDSSLEPVKLQLPTTDRPSYPGNTTELSANTTRFLPDNIPVSLQALSKFVT